MYAKDVTDGDERFNFSHLFLTSTSFYRGCNGHFNLFELIFVISYRHDENFNLILMIKNTFKLDKMIDRNRTYLKRKKIINFVHNFLKY